MIWRRQRVILALLAAGSAGAVVLAQQAPARDVPARPAAAGTASITGTIVTGENNGRPLRRVVLTLSSASTSFATGRTAVTDDQGRFAFTRLPAGNYAVLRATKGGFVPAAYGQKRPGGMGTPITLTEGQHLTADMRMLRGAVITGMVLDDRGRPAAPVQVQASAIRVVDGRRLPGTISAGRQVASTDDRGMYRIYGLPPGDYVVAATPRAPNNEDIHQLTPEEIRWAQQQLQGGGITAQGAGTAGAPPTTALTLPPGPAVTYAPIYYAAAPDAASATIVTLTDGQERTGVDFVSQFVKTAKISGTVVDPAGQPGQSVQLSVVPKIDGPVMNSAALFNMMIMNRPVVTAGKFTIAALSPGEYTISARGVAAGTPVVPPGPGGKGPPLLWATAEITVTGQDQTGIAMQLQPGMTISGRVRFEGTTLQAPADLSRVSLRLSAPPSTSGTTVSFGLSNPQMAPDGSFMLANVIPGRYLLQASVPGGATPGPSGSPTTTWQAKTAMIEGVDAIDSPFEVKPGGDISNAVVTFTDSAGEVSGTLSDAAGKPTSDFSVILFSTDKSLWIARSRRLRMPVRTGLDGKFKFTGVAPGEYYLAALTDFEPNDATNPAFLEQVQSSGIKITVADGEKKTQDLKLAGQ